MEEKVKEWVNAKKIIEGGDRIVVGISGGPDSMALLHLLLSMKKDYALTIFAAHVNHSTRNGDSDRDQAFVERECERLEVPCFAKKFDSKQKAKEEKKSEEEIGRIYRYAFFDEVLEKVGANKIATAHQRDDVVETFLMNLTRGTGLSGLIGIKSVNGRIIRPLLCATKDEIFVFLKKQNILYVEDYTNLESTYTRNKFRNDVLPYLKRNVNSNVEENIVNTIALLEQDHAYIEEQVEKVIGELAYWYDEQEKIARWSIKELRLLSPSILSRIIRRSIKQILGNLNNISSVHIHQIMELLQKETGKEIRICEALLVRVEYDDLLFEHISQDDGKQEVWVKVDEIQDEVTLTVFERKLRFRLLENSELLKDEIEKNKENRQIEYFNFDRIDGKLVVRTRKDGDRIAIHKEGKTKKVKEILIELKMPERARKEVLIVSDQTEILWIGGIRYNPLFEVLSDTKKVLKIELT